MGTEKTNSSGPVQITQPSLFCPAASASGCLHPSEAPNTGNTAGCSGMLTCTVTSVGPYVLKGPWVRLGMACVRWPQRVSGPQEGQQQPSHSATAGGIHRQPLPAAQLDLRCTSAASRNASSRRTRATSRTCAMPAASDGVRASPPVRNRRSFRRVPTAAGGRAAVGKRRAGGAGLAAGAAADQGLRPQHHLLEAPSFTLLGACPTGLGSARLKEPRARAGSELARAERPGPPSRAARYSRARLGTTSRSVTPWVATTSAM